jgi:hypothetical protein
MAVHIHPLPPSFRTTSKRLRPQHPPVFDDPWPPSRADAKLAIALIEALDPESRDWYASSLERLCAFLANADDA